MNLSLSRTLSRSPCLRPHPCRMMDGLNNGRKLGSNAIAADGVPDQAFTNAERIIRWELNLDLFHEQTVQSWFLPYHWFIQFWNTYYGTAHFIVTAAVFVLLFTRRADVFPQWRNSLAAMTALAIIGFAWFPLMPPRLLDSRHLRRLRLRRFAVRRRHVRRQRQRQLHRQLMAALQRLRTRALRRRRRRRAPLLVAMWCVRRVARIERQRRVDAQLVLPTRGHAELAIDDRERPRVKLPLVDRVLVHELAVQAPGARERRRPVIVMAYIVMAP